MYPDKEPIYTFTHDLRSRYSETDQMGYVYYGRYLEYFEEARTEMIRSIGYSYKRLEENGVMLPVVHTGVDYKAPVFYDELMHIKVTMFDLPTVKLETYYEVSTDRRDKPHILGNVILCFMKEDTRRPCRAPAGFTEKLTTAVNS